jgi:glutathione S-transferase
MPELLGLSYSPWTEKARWALDVRGVSYDYRQYQPLIGELALRRKLGRWSGPVSVPVLTDDRGVAHSDSEVIARWADERGTGPKLFPTEHDARIRELVALSERALDAGRSLSLIRMLEDDEALTEMIPKALRGPLGPLGPRIGGQGVRRTLRKYGGHLATRAEHESRVAALLEEIRAVLDRAPAGAGPKTLLGSLTFADIAVSQALGFVAPAAFGIRIGRASRRAFTDPALAARFPDLLAWRDALYDAHRPRTKT